MDVLLCHPIAPSLNALESRSASLEYVCGIDDREERILGSSNDLGKMPHSIEEHNPVQIYHISKCLNQGLRSPLLR